jgi:hypothetical protein
VKISRLISYIYAFFLHNIHEVGVYRERRVNPFVSVVHLKLMNAFG